MCISHQHRLNLPTPSAATRTNAACEPSNKRKHSHIIVHHDYHDHAADPIVSLEDTHQRNTSVPSFPHRLYEFLENTEKEAISHIVSWQPHGRCFVVHEPELFKEILPHYFAVTKVASFQRQLNLYGFLRLTRGADKAGYYNERFLRGRPDLLPTIQRVKVKGTGVRARSCPQDEPDFYRMAPLVCSSPTRLPLDRSASIVSDSTTESSFPDQPQVSEPGVVFGWGLPFQYVPHELPNLPAQPEPCWTLEDADLLGDVDLDDIVEDMCNDDCLLADLLERAVA